MLMRNAVGLLGLVALVGLGGCTPPPDIQYAPTTAASVATKASVGLSVLDKRSEDKGGGTSQMGQVRSGIGIPHGVEDKKPDVVVKTVTDATTDALHKSAVGVQKGGPKTLVATVKEYWFDGYMGYSATVTVSYQLNDAAGKQLWAAEVVGKAGDTNAFTHANRMAENIFAKALAELATKASEQFASPAFQQALAQ